MKSNRIIMWLYSLKGDKEVKMFDRSTQMKNRIFLLLISCLYD